MKDSHTLLEEAEIVDTINRLFIGTDDRNWTQVKQCFSDKVLFDMTSMAGGEPSSLTPQEIADVWEKGLQKLKAVHHQAGNYRVTVRDQDADAFCYATATHYLPNPTKRNVRTFVGSYDIHLIGTQTGWKIDRFKFNLKYLDGNLDLESSAEGTPSPWAKEGPDLRQPPKPAQT